MIVLGALIATALISTAFVAGAYAKKELLPSALAAKKSRQLQERAGRKSNEERQREYDAARKSMLGEFASESITGPQKCPINEKARRRKQRLDLTKRAMLTCPNPQKFVAAQLRRDMDEVEYMRCAQYVYYDENPDAPADLRDKPPPGFRHATQNELGAMGLTKSMLDPEGTAFKAAVYMKDERVWGEDPRPAAVVAFRGSTPAEEDWQNNFAQNENQDAPYYRRSVLIGNRLDDTSSAKNTHIVGHSLGGGLASAAQGASGSTASTYNSAGLHPETVAKYSKSPDRSSAEPGQITAIRVEGEVLTETQEAGFLSLFAEEAVGRKRDIKPVGTEAEWEDNIKADEEDDYETYLHGMDQVIAAMEKEKSANERALDNCLR